MDISHNAPPTYTPCETASTILVRSAPRRVRIRMAKQVEIERYRVNGPRSDIVEVPSTEGQRG